MEEVSPNQEALRTNTKSLSSPWNNWRDKVQMLENSHLDILEIGALSMKNNIKHNII